MHFIPFVCVCNVTSIFLIYNCNSQADPYLKGEVRPKQDMVPDSKTNITSKVLQVREALYSLNKLEIKLKVCLSLSPQMYVHADAFVLRPICARIHYIFIILLCSFDASFKRNEYLVYLLTSLATILSYFTTLINL